MMPRRPAIALTTALLLLAALPAARAEAARPQGWLGVLLSEESRSQDADRDGSSVHGVMIGGVVTGSPAQKAGIRSRDRILMIDGAEVSSPAEVVAKLRGTDPGSWVTFTIERRGKKKEIEVSIDARPSEPSRLRMVEGWIGLEAIDLPASLRSHFGAPQNAGVMISQVADGGPALAAGLDLGDVVFEVEGEPITSSGHLRAAISSAGVGNRIEIKLMRNGAEMTVEPMVEERPRGD